MTGGESCFYMKISGFSCETLLKKKKDFFLFVNVVGSRIGIFFKALIHKYLTYFKRLYLYDRMVW